MLKARPLSVKFKSIAVLLVAIWLGLFLYTGLSQTSNWLTSHHFNNNFFPQLKYLTYRVWFPWLALTPVVLWLATKFPVKPQNWLKALLLHSVFLLGLSLIAGLGISLHYHFMEDMTPGMESYQPWQHTGHFLFGDGVFLFNTIIYTVLVANLNIKHFAQIATEEALAASELQSRLMESQLQALKMQINPHFLFNTLNVISVLVMKSEQGKAGEMINRLSKFFRQTLDDRDSQLLPLSKELDHIEQYLGIEQVRFGERLRIETKFDDASQFVMVPAMLLQPLVENAMQHGLGEKEGQGLLTLTGQVEHGWLRLKIEDNGVGCNFNDKDFKEGIGISNVRARLEQVYGAQFEFTLATRETGGVIATLALPTRNMEREQNNDD